MAGVKISDLDLVTQLNDSDYLPLARGAETKKIEGKRFATKAALDTLTTRVDSLSSGATGTSVAGQTIFTNVFVVGYVGECVFTLKGSLNTFSSNANAYLVTIDGVLQEPNVDYNITNGTVVTTNSLPVGTRIIVVFRQTSDPFDPVKNTITADGSASSFALTFTPSTNEAVLRVSIDGVVQEPDEDYDINGTLIEFSAIPAAGSKIVVISENVLVTTNPVKYTLTGDGATTSFFMNGLIVNSVNPAVCRVTIEGIIQEPGTAYAISGSSIWFNQPPGAGSKIVVIF